MFNRNKKTTEIVIKDGKKFIKVKRNSKRKFLKENTNILLAVGIIIITSVITLISFNFLNNMQIYKEGSKTATGENGSFYNILSSDEPISQISSSRNENVRRAIISFIDDDGNGVAYKKLSPIFKEKKVPYTISITTGLSIGKMTDEHMKEANASGFEFASNTVNNFDLTTLTEEQVEQQLKDSKEWIEAKGYKCPSFVYPSGKANALAKVLAKKYYKCAFIDGPGDNPYPLDLFSIKRVAMGSQFDPPNHTFNDTSLLEYYESRVDSALAGVRLLVFVMHPNDLAFNNKQMENLGKLIDYIKSKDIEILTASKAVEEFNKK